MLTPSAVLQPQPVDGSDSAARGNIAFPPFLWMPHSPADTTQQGLPRAGSQGTVSANVGLRSVNQLHGLASPLQNAVSGSQAPADQAEAGLQWQHLSSKDAAAAGSSKSESGLHHPTYQPDRHQQPCQTAQPAQQASPSLPQHASSMDHAVRQPQQQQQQQQHPGHGSAANTPSVVGRLNGVRMVEGGWQARLGYGRSKSKQSLGTYSTGKLPLCFDMLLQLSCCGFHLCSLKHVWYQCTVHAAAAAAAASAKCS